MNTVTGVEEHDNEYDWWPIEVYERFHGDVDTNNKGHTRLPNKGKSGVAIFLRPPGVIRVKPRQSFSACRCTCTASTSNGIEHWPGELDASFSLASAAMSLRTKEVQDARDSVKGMESLVDDNIAATMGPHMAKRLAQTMRRIPGASDDDVRSVISGKTGAGLLNSAAIVASEDEASKAASDDNQIDDEVYGSAAGADLGHRAHEAQCRGLGVSDKASGSGKNTGNKAKA